MTPAERTSVDDVFINCPFDGGYLQIFRALIFGIFACGFRPRSALELEDSGQLRLEKLYGLVEECRFGIHDLSRTQLDPINKLPRFNMPLELGLFLGAKRYGSKSQKLKRALILDVEKHRYQKFISDLAGMDIKEHGSDAAKALRQTRNWLANVSRRDLPSSTKIERLYRRFEKNLPAICDEREFELTEITYVDFERIVVAWLLEATPT